MSVRQFEPLTRFLRTRPLMLSACLFLIGCIMGRILNLNVYLLSGGCICLIAAGLFLARRNRRWVALIIAIAMLPLGALRFTLAWRAADPLPEQKNAAITGDIVDLFDYDIEKTRRVCAVNHLTIDGVTVSGTLRLYIRGEFDDLKEMHIAQRVECTGNIYAPDGASNPFEFDFADYLRVQGLNGYASVKVENAAFFDRAVEFSDVPAVLRGKIAARIDRLFPENGGIIKAFLIGDRSDLADDLRAAYNRSGIAHLLAISGMHISILAGFCMLLLRRFLKRGWAFGITMALLLAYGFLIGFSASLLRAFIMFGLYNAAPLLGRQSDPPTNIAAALIVNLALRPIDILNVSFILSYAASAGIIFLSDPLWALLHLERFRNLKPENGVRGFLKTRLPRSIAQSLILTLSAQIASLPAVIRFFGAQPVWGLVTNLIAVPIAMIGYIAALIAVILGFAPLPWIADRLYDVLNLIVRLCSDLPLSMLRIARFPWWLIVIYALALLLSTTIMRTPRRIARYLPLLILPAILISNLCAYSTSRGCSIVFLDAGEADSAVIRAEHKIYLVDAGDRYSPIADYVSGMNYEIEGVFLSHPHADHVCGMADLLEVCRPKCIYVPVSWDHYPPADSVRDCMDRIQELNIPIKTLSAGDAIQLSENVSMKVLHPTAGIFADSANDDSMVLQMEYGDCRALFCADVPAESAPESIGDIDILKTAHHGSRDSMNAELIQKTSPSVAIVSADHASNPKHPDAQTIAYLQGSGAAVYRTDECGAITCTLNTDGSVQVQTYLYPEVSE